MQVRKKLAAFKVKLGRKTSKKCSKNGSSKGCMRISDTPGFKSSVEVKRKLSKVTSQERWKKLVSN